MNETVTPLEELLAPARFFDFTAHPFEHHQLFTRPGVRTVVDVLNEIGPYCHELLAAFPRTFDTEYHVEHDDWPSTVCEGRFNVILSPGAYFVPDRIVGGMEDEHFIFIDEQAQVRGGVFDVRDGSIVIGAGARVEGAWVCGPAIIGEASELRPGAYLRGNVILGRRGVFRGELKNVVVMDDADFPHPSYLGDSICGFQTHFGNQATAANVNIFGRKDPLVLRHHGASYPLGRRKIGIVMGDYCQVGCNAVSDPATFLLPHTIVYSLTRINSGIYGPREVLKNKPMEHGVIERAPLH